ncbi:MAG: thioredoxin family protein [Bacteroidota bacterium]
MKLGSQAQTILPSDSTSFSQFLKTTDRAGKVKVLFFHFNGCPPCKRMEDSVFTDETVIRFFEKDFSAYPINGLNNGKDGIALAKQYQVKGYPSTLILDDKDSIRWSAVGYLNSAGFIEFLQQGLVSEGSITNLRKRYESGNRDPSFLKNYLEKLSLGSELTDYSVIDTFFQYLPAAQYGSPENLRFIYKYGMYNFKYFLDIQSPLYNYIVNNRSYFTDFDSAQVLTRIVWIAAVNLDRAIETHDSTRFIHALEVLKPYKNRRFDFIDHNGVYNGKTTCDKLEVSMLAFNQKQSPTKYSALEQSIIKASWNQPKDLNDIAWYYTGIYSLPADTDRLKVAEKAARRAIELDPAYFHLDTYATVLYKQHNYKKALKYADLAIQTAQNQGIDPEETRVLKGQIERELSNY